MFSSRPTLLAAALVGAVALSPPARAQPYVIEPAPAVVYPAPRPVVVYPAPPPALVYRPAPVVVAPTYPVVRPYPAAYPIVRPYPYARVGYPVARPYPYARRVAYGGPHGCAARVTRVTLPGGGTAARRVAGCR